MTEVALGTYEGRITNVVERQVGSELVGDVTAGATEITVGDGYEFDADGGSLVIGDELVSYTVASTDDGILELSIALSDSHSDGDEVYVYPTTMERIAYVAGPGQAEELPARVPQALYDRVPVGIRQPPTDNLADPTGEQVTCEIDGHDLVIADVVGEAPLIDGSFIDRYSTDPAIILDGLPPDHSPDPTIYGAIGALAIRWSQVANHDLVTYELHLSDSSGFTPGAGTLVTETSGDLVFVRKTATGGDLVLGTTYYAVVIARDGDGAASPSAEASGEIAALDPSEIGTDGSPPASSPTPTINAGDTFFAAKWTPISNVDPVTYELHISASTGFAPDGTTKYGETAAASMVAKTLPDGSAFVFGTTYYFKVIAKDADGSAAASSQASASLIKLPSSSQTTDGAVPASSPTPTVVGGPTFLAASWVPITNNDPVVYEVHISTSTGFTPSGGTKYAETAAGSVLIKTDAAGAALSYGTTYYVKIVAKDGDGSAAASSQGSGSMVQIVTGDVLDGSIIGTDLANDTLTATQIAASAITPSELAALAVTSGKIAASAVGTTELAANAVTDAKIAADTITAASIAANAITPSELAALAVTAGKIATDAVGSAEIVAGAVSTSELAANAVTDAKIAADTITAASIAANAITPSELAALAVTAGKIATDAVGSAEIIAGAVNTSELAATAVTTAKIAADAVTAAEIATGAVGNTELAAGAVTAAKITAGTITTAEIASGTITAGNIAALTITAAQIAAGTITAAKIATDTITANEIAAGAIGASEIAANAVIAGKIAAGIITATELAAGSATFTKLTVGSFDNVASDGGFEAGAAPDWTLTSAATGTTTPRSGLRCLSVTAVSKQYSNRVVCASGDSFYVEAYARRTGGSAATTARVALRWLDSTGAEISSTTGTTTAQTTSYAILSTSGAAPANTAWVQVTLEVVANDATNVLFDDVYARRQIVSSVIVDGTIVAADIAANTITAAKIAADTITATEIAASAIGTSELAANAVIAGKIAAGIITATEIASHTITAAVIAAGTITATEVATDTITATQIAAGAIGASELAANSVIAGKIAAGIITTTEIAANTILAGNIAANTITAAKIAADTITANEIAASAITASELAANSATFAKLTVGSFDNVVADGGFEVTGSPDWTLTSAARGTTTPRSGLGCLSVTAVSKQYSNRVTCGAGDPFYAEVYVRRTGGSATTTARVALRWLDSTGAEISSTTGTTTATTTTYALLSVTGTAPTNTAWVQITLEVVANDATNVLFDDVSARRQITSSLIVDGTIQAADILANTITAAKITAGTITTTEIAASTITAANIAAATITATQIAANTITAAKIAASTITATEIAASTITAAKMNISQLSAIAADLGTVTAGTYKTGVSNPLLQIDTSNSGELFITDASGNKDVSLTGANGLDLLGGVSSSPPNTRMLRWLSASDASVIADLRCYESGGRSLILETFGTAAGGNAGWTVMANVNAGYQVGLSTSLTNAGASSLTVTASGASATLLNQAGDSDFVRATLGTKATYGLASKAISPASNTTTFTVTHGLGKTPVSVVANMSNAGGAAAPYSVSTFSYTSTTFSVQVNLGSSVAATIFINWIAMG